LDGYTEPNCLAHRAESAAWLGSQASDNLREIKFLHKEVLGESVGQRGGKPKSGPTRSVKGVSSGANAPKRQRRASFIGAPSDVERVVEAGLIG
jgi:hypothetical protein